MITMTRLLSWYCLAMTSSANLEITVGKLNSWEFEKNARTCMEYAFTPLRTRKQWQIKKWHHWL